MIKRIGRKVDWFISNFSKINYLQILGSNKGGRTMDTGVVRRMGEQRIGRGLGESWRIKRYGYFGISAAIRDHSMLPFQCFAPPSVKVAKIRRRWGEFCEGCGRRIPGNNTPVAGNGQSRRNFDTLGISPVESTEITGTYDISLPFPRKCRIIFARIITCTYNSFLACNSKYNTVKEEI